jgi:hypothetical protein
VRSGELEDLDPLSGVGFHQLNEKMPGRRVLSLVESSGQLFQRSGVAVFDVGGRPMSRGQASACYPAAPTGKLRLPWSKLDVGGSASARLARS